MITSNKVRECKYLITETNLRVTINLYPANVENTVSS